MLSTGQGVPLGYRLQGDGGRVSISFPGWVSGRPCSSAVRVLSRRGCCGHVVLRVLVVLPGKFPRAPDNSGGLVLWCRGQPYSVSSSRFPSRVRSSLCWGRYWCPPLLLRSFCLDWYMLSSRSGYSRRFRPRREMDGNPSPDNRIAHDGFDICESFKFLYF